MAPEGGRGGPGDPRRLMKKGGGEERDNGLDHEESCPVYEVSI